MRRNRYLIAYDICDAKRLRQVARLMVASGERVQYSVFFSDLSRVELAALLSALRRVIDGSADTVVAFDLGPVESFRSDSRMLSLGVALQVCAPRRMIV